MKISSLNTYYPSFQAINYSIRPFPAIHLDVVDTNADRSDEAVLVNKQTDGKVRVYPMKQVDNNLVFKTPGYDPLNFFIGYPDNAYTNKGELFHVDTPHLVRKAGIIARAQHRQASVLPIKEGETVGKIIFDDGFVQGNYKYDRHREITEPSIIVCRNWDAYLDDPNMVGIIMTYDGNDAYSHNPFYLKAAVDVSAIVLDEEMVDKLRNLDEKKVKIICKGGRVDFYETDEPSKPMNKPAVNVPILKYCNKILTSKEYSPDVIGTKAVNLRRLEELKEQGKINAVIPKSIALPFGYIEADLDNYYTGERRNTVKLMDAFEESGKLDEIMKAMEENGVNTERVMIRSAFNCEDLPDYSAAGVYASFCDENSKEGILYRLHEVVVSKHYSDPIYSRKIYNIPDDIVKPGAIIQNRVDPDYKFTIYTDDENGNVRINLYTGERAIHSDVFHPHVFRFNRETGKLTYDSIQMTDTEVTFDENGNFVDITPLEEDLGENKELFERLESAIKDALVVEKEFGAPQDIEGGIKDGKVYFWQSRNIVR